MGVRGVRNPRRVDRRVDIFLVTNYLEEES